MNRGRRRFLQTGAGFASLLSAGCGRSQWLEALRLPAAPKLGPFTVPDGEKIDDVAHALNRCSFGPGPLEYSQVRTRSQEPREAAELWIEEQIEAQQDDRYADIQWRRRFEIVQQDPVGQFFEFRPEHILDDLLGSTLLRAIASRRQLNEVMVHFWTDHFNIDSSKGDCRWLVGWDHREVVRKHALGRFRDLVRGSALSPAMLWYLDGRVNQAGDPNEKPNENYARELLELHTLGVHGGYSQRDVMEVARALSGWIVRERGQAWRRLGEPEFRPERHDDGAKEVLAQVLPAGGGKQDLERVLDIVCEHPSTARYIAWKLCRWFIADEPPAEATESVAAAFSRSGGDIRETLRAVFQCTAFWDQRGNKFKRPFHFVVSAVRGLGVTGNPAPSLVDHLRRMGHVPFQYPTPDGYPAEAAPWMESLLWRWRFAYALANGEVKGAEFDLERLTEYAGGREKLTASLLGRRAGAGEAAVLGELDFKVEAVLASPAFQWF